MAKPRTSRVNVNYHLGRIEVYKQFILWNGKPWPALIESLTAKPLVQNVRKEQTR